MLRERKRMRHTDRQGETDTDRERQRETGRQRGQTDTKLVLKLFNASLLENKSNSA